MRFFGGGDARGGYSGTMTTWEYVTVPLIPHATKQILDGWGKTGWELVSVLASPEGGNPVAYLKRPVDEDAAATGER